MKNLLFVALVFLTTSCSTLNNISVETYVPMWGPVKFTTKPDGRVIKTTFEMPADINREIIIYISPITLVGPDDQTPDDETTDAVDDTTKIGLIDGLIDKINIFKKKEDEAKDHIQ